MAASCRGHVPFYEQAQFIGVDFVRYLLEQDRLAIDLARELAIGVVDECSPVGYPGAEVGAGRAEHHHPPTGHVLAAMVPDTLDNSRGAAITDAEAFAGTTGRKQASPGCAVEERIAGNRLGSVEWDRGGGPDGNLATSHPFADVVV